MLMRNLWKWLGVLAGSVVFCVSRSYAVMLRGSQAWGGEALLLLLLPVLICWMWDDDGKHC